MGLRGEITDDLLEALSSADDLADASSTVYIVKSKETDGGDVLGPKTTEESTHEAKLAVISSYEIKNIDNVNILLGDKRVTIFQRQLDCMPVVNDKIIIDGKRYNLIAVSEDPAHVTWSLTVRG